MSDHVYDAGHRILLDAVPDALTAAPGRGLPDQLRTYWTTGEGGTVKIRWGTDGSFERCERLLRKYFPANPGGLCAKLHKRATGEWPAEKGIQSAAGWSAPSAQETAFHLPGRHNQETHGNRVGKPNLPGKTGLGAEVARSIRGTNPEEERGHLDALRDSIKRAKDREEAERTARESGAAGEPIPDLTVPGAEALQRFEKLFARLGGKGYITRDEFPAVKDGGINNNALYNLMQKGFLDSERVDTGKGYSVSRLTLSEKGRSALDALKAGGRPGGAAKEKVSKGEAQRRRVLKGIRYDTGVYTAADLRATLTPQERQRVDRNVDSLVKSDTAPTNPNVHPDSYLASPDWRRVPDGMSKDEIEELFQLRLVESYGPGDNPQATTKAGGHLSKTWWAKVSKTGRQYADDIANQATQTPAAPKPSAENALGASRSDKERRARIMLGDAEYERRRKAGTLPKSLRADAGEDEAMSTEEVTAHAGPHADLADLEAADRALAFLDEPDEFAESMLPRFTRWDGMLAPIGKPTGDRRIFEAGALTNRDLPLPLMWQEKTDDGHARSSVVGTIEELDHREDGTYGVGRFLDPEIFPDAQKAMALLKAKVNGPSVDLDDVTYAMKNADGTPFDVAAYEIEAMAGKEPAKPLLSVSSGRISAATLVSIPAFAEVAHTWTLADMVDEDGFSAALAADMDDCEDCFEGAALSAAGYVGPPLASFLPRDFSAPTPLTVADDGTVYGHLAAWGTCHVGFPGTCVTPPQSKASYAYFHTGEVTTAEGERLPVGRLVLGAKHADLAKGYRASAQHYDETGRVFALVRAYEDAHGIAFAGVLVHDLTPEERAEFAAMPLSGDWRRVGGNLELIGAISVPVPGFPVARSTGTDPAALIAAGVVHSLDAQPVDAAPVTFSGGTITVNFNDVDPEVFKLLTGVTLREAEAATAAGPGAELDFAAQVDAELARVGDILDRERMALLDNIPTLGE